MPTRRCPAVCAVFALGLLGGLLAGCGGSSSGNGIAAKSPAEIIAASKAAADAATSARVAGSITSKGAPITLDLQLAQSGAQGTLALSGVGFEVIVTGGNVYIKGSPAFYRRIGGAAAAQLLQGRWLKAPVTNPEFASISSLADLHKLVDATLANHTTLTKSGTTVVHGQKVVGVSDPTQGGTLYVATIGRPYPVQVSKGGSGGGTVSFDHWDQPVSISAPANAIDLAQLRSGH